MKKIFLSSIICSLAFSQLQAQLLNTKETFTHSDTLRGSLNPERTWWNVLRYDIKVQPDFNSKTISGAVTIFYDCTATGNKTMQIDLQQPMIIDSIIQKNTNIEFEQIDINAWHVFLKNQGATKAGASYNSKPSITVYYHGKPREAVRPPWDGGWIWKKDAQGRPWMSVACQGLGASVWYPCKDHQSDEPDNGASLTMIVPDTLVAVGNGRLKNKSASNGLATYAWEVTNPINNYTIIPYIGKYVNWNDTLQGEKGILDLGFWVLDYNIEKAKKQFEQVKPMIRCFEYWFGPYPFYEDSYKLVDAPHLGMEHQSAVAYGNQYMNGYLGRDLSGTNWGLKWDYIIVHESGHEWFANNITTNDIADMWVHEGFTCYSETLFTTCQSGLDAGNEYNYGLRKGIKNATPVIGQYGVNKEGSGDMYSKGSAMLNTIRYLINDDEKFRKILRGLSKTFYHQTVTSKQVEQYISKEAGMDLSKVFDQYLRDTKIPLLEYYYSADSKKVFIRWSNCIPGFNMPLFITDGRIKQTIKPSEKWTEVSNASAFDPDYVNKHYYINLKKVEGQ
jgi:aminopeptidase N